MQLEGYSDLVKLTRGGMATVYKAQQNSLNRTVAIKFLSAELLWDDQAKNFFDQESLVIARLNHPNIIHIIDRGLSAKGRPYFVMDYIQGRELSEITRHRKLSLNARVQLLLQTCKGMAFAHKNGVVHRDIKPANILIDNEGHVFILDFGIAWLEASGKPEVEEIVGTPDYMSPEQFSNPQCVSPLSDIYSLGALMFELFTGKLPAEKLDDLAGSLTGLPEALAELIIRCLKTEPNERPESADEVAFSLLEILNGAHLKQSDKNEAKAAIGKASDKFELLDVLSRNRFGAVYLFQDSIRKQMIVVKKSLKTHAGFKQATQLTKIQHKNLARVLGTSKNSNAFIVVMEHLAGGSLQDRLSRAFTLQKFVPVALEICSAMQQAHQNHIMHGDLRPSNILFNKSGELKITDFGFERHYQQVSDIDWYQPENKAPASVSRDIFSAGIIFYQMLTANRAKMKFGLLKAAKEFDRLDVHVQEIIQNMLEMQSVNRWQSFAEISTALKAIPLINESKKQQWSSQKTGISIKLIVLIIMLINVAGLIAFYFLNEGFQQFVTSLLSGFSE
ncbi:MAG: protein kinase [Gammaproteobacteria bacterium]|nr:protein kinase [Gammaproteobacteria bacterium]